MIITAWVVLDFSERAFHKEYDMAVKRSWTFAFAILACLMFAWATGAGRPYQASASGVVDPTCTSSSPCIEYDNNGTGPSIRGISVVGNGLSGSTKNKSTSATNGRAGLMGNDVGTGNFNSGVHGLSVNGTGVSGQSTNATGVSGTSTVGIGVFGDAPSGVGVRGDTGDGVGVFGDTNSGIGVVAESASGIGANVTGGFTDSSNRHYPALSIVSELHSGSGESDLIDGCPPGSVTQCNFESAVFIVGGNGLLFTKSSIGSNSIIDASGDISTHGNFVIFGSGEYLVNSTCVAGCSASAAAVRRVQTYVARSSQPTIEDNGEAQLVNGFTYVRMDPAFVNVIDQRSVYSVSITPEGNSNGLYVSQKTLTGFAVRENNGGKSTLAFEYRIVAKPFDSIAKRLPMVDIPLQRIIGARSWHPGGVGPVH
jgi:hypothetical protein